MRTHEAVEGRLIGARKQIPVDRRHANRGGVHAVQKGIEARLRVLAFVLFPELEHVGGAFTVRKARQVFLPTGVEVVLEQFCAVARRLIRRVTHHVAHQAHKRQVDGFTDRVAQGRVAAIVLNAEVIEVVHAAAGEKTLPRICRIGAVERCIEHAGKARVRVADQVVHGPTAQAVLLIDLDFLQVGAGLARVPLMQLSDDLQVSGHHPQLGGRAQLQFAPFIDVERLVRAVGLHPCAGTIGRQLKQGEAVPHLRRAAGGQQPLAQQSEFAGNSGVGQVAQVFADLALQVVLQGAGG